MATDTWGIADGYHDALGAWRPVSPRTRQALREAMGVSAETPPEPPVLVVRAGEQPAIARRALLTLEDGTRLDVGGTLPADVPTGYHELTDLDRGDGRRLIVSPGRCPVPAARAWGWAAQVYAIRSELSWGIGDLADLQRLGRWSTGLGASLVLINPLAAAMPFREQHASPYCPSSRRFLNALYIRVEDAPGAEALGPALDRLVTEGRALDGTRVIDRARVFDLKMRALEAVWQKFDAHHPDFLRYVRERGAALRDFAVFNVLAEQHGAGWRRWPAEHRRPESPAVAAFAQAHARRVAFHQWLQWIADTQLGRAARAVRIVHDLPIGVDPEGADAWVWQDSLASHASIGAPPDRYVRRGQDWGLPPFIPHRLRAAGYDPFVQTIRAALRHAGGLRIDHVMGLFRLFWVPAGHEPSDGGYVRYPADDLLAIVALESERAGAWVVGEDLGTVEAGVRERLAAHGVLSYRVAWFEEGPPRDYPELAMAAVTTHDLPTIGGLWTGADVAELQALGVEPNAPALEATRRRLADLTGTALDCPVDEIVEATHRTLAEAPSLLVTATVDDAVGAAERPNVPGTTAARNWSLALPASLEAIEAAALPRRIAAALSRRRDGGRPPVAS